MEKENKNSKKDENAKETAKQIVINAENAILGRLASYAAKQALLGKNIIILNSEKSIILGNKKDILEKFAQKRRRHGSSQKGPIYDAVPEKMMKRTIRGMLSRDKSRGNAALNRIRAYNKIPSGYSNVEAISAGREKNAKYLSLGEIAKLIRK